MNNGFFTKFDSLVSTKIVLLWNPVLTKIMVFITNIASTPSLFILSLTFLGVLAYKRKWRDSLLLICALAGTRILELLTKFMVHRARPENALIEVSNYSFPSGHAAMSIVFFSLLIYSFKDDIKNKMFKNFFITANVFLFILIGFSRIYLNVHWLSDVLAGFALGSFWLTLMILTFQSVIALAKKTFPS